MTGGSSTGIATVVGAGAGVALNPDCTLIAGECPKSFPAKLMPTDLNLAMDFAGLIPAGAVITGISVDSEVYSGVDDSPEDVLNGDPILYGTTILQRVTGGVAYNTYALTFEVVLSDGESIAVNGFLKITPF